MPANANPSRTTKRQANRASAPRLPSLPVPPANPVAKAEQQMKELAQMMDAILTG